MSPKKVVDVVDGTELGDDNGMLEDDVSVGAEVGEGTVVSRIEPSDEMEVMVRHTTNR